QDSCHRLRIFRLHANNARVRIWRANNRGVRLPFDPEIIAEAALSREQAKVFLAKQRLSDHAHLDLPSVFLGCAPACFFLTWMLWPCRGRGWTPLAGASGLLGFLSSIRAGDVGGVSSGALLFAGLSMSICSLPPLNIYERLLMTIRIAAIEVSHWHALNDAAYLRHLVSMPDVRLVAIQDSDAGLV